jgi:ParB-like chromosome segregation protein Spo0J
MKRAVDWNPELEHVQVRSLDSIFPAPDNDVIYRAIALDDPEIIELARSIKEHGLLDPLLISQDGFIISGHRRRIASLRAGLKEVPVKIYPISRKKSPDEFRRLLVEANSQRLKNVTEMVHESAIKMDRRRRTGKSSMTARKSKSADAKVFR